MITFNVRYDSGIPEFFVDQNAGLGVERLYGASLDPSLGIFRYPAYWPFAWEFLKDCRLVLGEFSLTDAAKTELAKQNRLFDRFANKELPPLPPDFFVYPPFKHQVEALSLLMTSTRNGLLYDRGLGKTKITIDAIRIKQKFFKDYPALIVTPPVTLYNWEEEFKVHSRGEVVPLLFHGDAVKTFPKRLLGEQVVITTYDTLRIHAKKLQQLNFKHVFFDESHRLRNAKGKNAKSALAVVQHIPFRTILSGSSHWDPRHLFTQLKILSDCLVPERTFTKFQLRFVEKAQHNHYAVKGYKGLDTLKQRLNMCCLYRLKEDCLDLPERVIENVYVKLSPQEVSDFNQLITEGYLDVETPEGEKDVVYMPPESVATQMITLQQISRGWINKSNRNLEICNNCEHLNECVVGNIAPYTKACKLENKVPPPTTYFVHKNPSVLDRALSMLFDILEEDTESKVILWFRSNVTLHLMREMFHAAAIAKEVARPTEELPVDYGESVVLVGGSNYKEVAGLFQTNPAVRVLFGQIKCGIGINLTAANYTFYPELTTNAEDFDQSIDRNYRPGQKKRSVVYKFIAKGTLDEGIDMLQDQKVNIQKAICDPSFCDKCAINGTCILNLCADPKSGECGLKTFIAREKLGVRKIKRKDVNISGTENDEDFIPSISLKEAPAFVAGDEEENHEDAEKSEFDLT